MKVKNTFIFNTSMLINMLLAISGIWLHYYLHLKENSLFFNPEIIWLIWLSIGILFIDIFNFAFLRKTRALGVFINVGLAIIGMIFMFYYAVIQIGISEFALIILGIIDILNSWIALESMGESVKQAYGIGKKQRSRKT